MTDNSIAQSLINRVPSCGSVIILGLNIVRRLIIKKVHLLPDINCAVSGVTAIRVISDLAYLHIESRLSRVNKCGNLVCKIELKLWLSSIEDP